MVSKYKKGLKWEICITWFFAAIRTETRHWGQTLSTCPCASSPPAGWSILRPSTKALRSLLFPHNLSHPTGLSLIQCSIAPTAGWKHFLWFSSCFIVSIHWTTNHALPSLLCLAPYRILNPRGICWLRETVWWESKNNREWSASNRNHGLEGARTLLSSTCTGGGPRSCISCRKYLH